MEPERMEDKPAAGQQGKIQQQEEKKQEARMKGILKEILSWVWVIFMALVIALFLNHFVIVNANVPTGSMRDTIQPGDRLIGFRLAYTNTDPKRGDIIIFNYPLDEEEIYIKRVIGLPGEHMEIRDGRVYIDGSDTPLEEPYIKGEWLEKNDGITYDIPVGCYFVMGDNRNNSSDGRYWAQKAVVEYGLADDLEEAVEMEYCFVNDEQILGKAIFRYYPSLAWMNQNPFEQETE